MSGLERGWPVPDGAHTLHLLGDLHLGVVRAERLAKLNADILESPLSVQVVSHLAVGDITQNGLSSEDAAALAVLAQLPRPWAPVLGGHDIEDDVRTPAAWAAVYGVPAENYVIDYDFCRLVVIGPDRYRNTLPDSAITYLDGALGATSKPCVIATHQPLVGTVGGSDFATYFSSDDPGWGYARTKIDPVLAAHPNAKVWVSGHTHSSLDAPGFVTPLTIGGRTLVAVNASSPYYQDRTGTNNRHSPIQSVFVTLLDDRVQVRFRDHGARAWIGPTGIGRVWEVML